MKHLKDTELGYFQHLCRAWKLSFVCFVHGMFPNIWKHKASDIINGSDNESS